MQKLFSTDPVPERDRFRRWQEFCSGRFAPFAYTNLSEGAFGASVEGASVGGLLFTRPAIGAVRLASTPRTARCANNSGDMLLLSLKLSGSMLCEQDGRAVVQGPGDFSIYDPHGQLNLTYPEPSRQLMIHIPRRRLESMLGSARTFTALAMHGDLPTATLVRSFLGDLLDVHERLSPEAAERMTSVGIDLIVASIAERMALETPKPLHGTLTVQRAKAHVEANIGDAALDPSQLAAATGVSLRHLQGLFAEHGRSVADWIWRRRLEVAAQRLADPGFSHVPLGTLAYGCGFSNPSHFARRFREQFDLSPGDYRRQALTETAVADTA